MSGNNEANRSMTMGGNLTKGMVGCWSVKAKKRDGGNRKRVQTAKQKAKGKHK